MTDPATITGTTRLYAVIGDPVTQVQAPRLVNNVFLETGRDAVLVPMHVRPDGLGAALATLRALGNVDGLLVTVPHKAAVARLASRISPTVEVTGTANALRPLPQGGWYADNFDGAGFVRGLRANGHDPAGTRVSIVGAGGAGSAIAVALLDAGVTRLSVADTALGRSDRLVARLSARWPGRVQTTSPVAATVGADMIVNATPLGMRPDDPLPFPAHGLSPDTVVADIVMQPSDTLLLRTAMAIGHRVHHGRHMLSHQLDGYREFFGW